MSNGIVGPPLEPASVFLVTGGLAAHARRIDLRSGRHHLDDHVWRIDTIMQHGENISTDLRHSGRNDWRALVCSPGSGQSRRRLCSGTYIATIVDMRLHVARPAWPSARFCDQ